MPAASVRCSTEDQQSETEPRFSCRGFEPRHPSRAQTAVSVAATALACAHRIQDSALPYKTPLATANPLLCAIFRVSTWHTVRWRPKQLFPICLAHAIFQFLSFHALHHSQLQFQRGVDDALGSVPQIGDQIRCPKAHAQRFFQHADDRLLLCTAIAAGTTHLQVALCSRREIGE